jgi:hypothetical protein
LRVAPAVVAVVTDIDLPRIDDSLPRTPGNPDRLVELAQRWRLGASTSRLVDALAASG